MRAAELCAGYGGLALAVEQVFGAETAWVSEFEEAPSRILAHHWPTVPNHGDMTKIDWSAVEPVDIISGGTPCQDLSAAGRRKGMTEGTRSNLWVQMRESIATIKPTYVVWENVRGAYSAGAYSEVELTEGRVGADGDPNLRALGRVLGDLSDLGYDCQWRGLRAADVGAPHNRFRVFVLATLKDAHLPTSGKRRLSAPGQAESWRARANTGGRGGTPTADSIGLHSERRGRYGDVAGPAGASESEGHQRQWDGDASHDRGSADPGVGGDSTTPHPEGRGWKLWDSNDERQASGDEYAPGDETSGITGSPQPSSIGFGEYEPAVRRWEQALGRRAPAPTDLGKNGKHRLSSRFVEWMMGVPDGWIVDVPGITRNEALKAAGNGVVPQQAIAALRDMLAAQQGLEVAA